MNANFLVFTSTNKKQFILADKSIPDFPGVYFFTNEKGGILYIGKATSLRFRVRSYFSQDITVTRGPKIAAMLDRVSGVKWQVTDSVLEALLLEASFIKKHQPPYNTDEKDDKSFHYVIITKEKFPRVLLVRGRDMQKKTDYSIQYAFGPFPQGGSLKEALKIVRRIFPFRDTCTLFSEKPCFNAQIGLCPGVCVGMVNAKEYAKTIRNVKLFFEGKKSTVVKNLESDMKEHAKNLKFEKAQSIKKTLFALNHIHDVALLKKEVSIYGRTGFESKQGVQGVNLNLPCAFRIEAYDVAHLSGKDVVGVMTVVENGVPNKSEYRKFTLKTQTNNDVGNLAEILTRRLQHPEWRLPDLIVADGFKLQINAVKRVLEAFDLSIPVVGVVKDMNHKPKGILGDAEMVKKYRDAILLANSESHRFAITFHRKRRAESFLR